MTTGPHTRRYQQPYSSKHVVTNVTDPVRSEESAYIKVFPRLLGILYRKQTPYNPVASTEKKDSSRKSVTTTSIRKDAPTQQAQQQQQPTPLPPPPPPVGFKTIGNVAAKSPGPMSSMPSDFEHIFHYSETQ